MTAVTEKVVEKTSRFQIEKLEERIAPAHVHVNVNAVRTINVGQGIVSVGNGNQFATQFINF